MTLIFECSFSGEYVALILGLSLLIAVVVCVAGGLYAYARRQGIMNLYFTPIIKAPTKASDALPNVIANTEDKMGSCVLHVIL